MSDQCNKLNTNENLVIDLEELAFLPVVPDSENEWIKMIQVMNDKIQSHNAAKYLIEFEQFLSNEQDSSMGIAISRSNLLGLDKKIGMPADFENKYECKQEELYTGYLHKIWNLRKEYELQLQEMTKEEHKRKKKLQKELNERHKHFKNSLKQKFLDAYTKMKLAINTRKKVISESFGSLGTRDNTNSFQKLFSWITESLYSTEIATIRIRLVRGLKDKLPAGRYAFVVSIHERISGKRIAGGSSSIADTFKNGILRKESILEKYIVLFDHEGSFQNVETLINSNRSDKVENCVKIKLPSKMDRKPYLVYSFELINLSGKNAGICVAWTAFPVENPHFGPITGKFKAPLVRGWIDPSVDQYWKMHQAYINNIDKWIGNVYFDVEVSSSINHERYELIEVSKNGVDQQELIKNTIIDNIGNNIEINSQNSNQVKLCFESSNNAEEKRKVYISEEELSMYKYEMKRKEGLKAFRLSLEKAIFIVKSVISDAGLSNLMSFYFLLMIFFLAVAFWMRIYVHYFGEWLLLQMLRLPSVYYKPSWIAVTVNYQVTLLSLAQEAVIVASGPVLNILVFVAMILIAFMFQAMSISIPEMTSKFILAFGLMTILDPILVLIVDCCYKNFINGDAFKLYQKFYSVNQSNTESVVWGVLLVISIYSWTILTGCIIMYHFLLKVFMNGQIIDVFRRLYGEAGSFYVPFDLEISNTEMYYAIMKALRYRGETGDVRRMVVMEYTLTDEKDSSFKEKTLHIIIYVIAANKKIKIYRQFIQYLDNTLVEIFRSEDAKRILNNRAANTFSEENIMATIEKEEQKRQKSQSNRHWQ